MLNPVDYNRHNKSNPTFNNFLDPHHTHFILVDSEEAGSEIEFRTKFESGHISGISSVMCSSQTFSVYCMQQNDRLKTHYCVISVLTLFIVIAASRTVNDKKLCYRRETARQLRMSTYRLANWSCSAHNTAESPRLYYFWHSNALIQELLAENAFCHEIATQGRSRSFILHSFACRQGVAYRHILLLAVSVKFSKT